MNGPLWLRRPLADPEVRLVCLPYAGGSAVVYREWQHLAPPWLEVCPVEYPGHGARLGQAPLKEVGHIVADAAGAVKGLMDRPVALFGHSMGGLIAYELARWMVWEKSCPPVHLFISASPEPRGPRSPASSRLSDEDMVQTLAEMGGTPQAVLDSPELLELALPVIRADFAALESYEHADHPRLPVPVTVIGGREDSVVAPERLLGWRECATEVGVHDVPGGHFFIHDLPRHLVAMVSATVANARTAGASELSRTWT